MSNCLPSLDNPDGLRLELFIAICSNSSSRYLGQRWRQKGRRRFTDENIQKRYV